MANDKPLYGYRMVSTITLYDIPVEVSYTYYPELGATEDEPPTDADIEIEAVMVDDFDIQLLLGGSTWNKLYEELFKVVKSIKENK